MEYVSLRWFVFLNFYWNYTRRCVKQQLIELRLRHAKNGAPNRDVFSLAAQDASQHLIRSVEKDL